MVAFWILLTNYGLRCAEHTVANIKNALAYFLDAFGILLTSSGLLCAEHNVANLKNMFLHVFLDAFGMQLDRRINEVKNHPDSNHAAGCYGLTAMKAELVTPKILHSPCDATRAAGSEIAQENWAAYDTKARGPSSELGQGASYTLIRGADTKRPSSIYAVTRNWSGNDLAGGRWCGSDSDVTNARTMAGLTASQGQSVTMDGGARQSTNADFSNQGTFTKAAQTATGGIATGRTSTRIIAGTGLIN